MTAANRPPQPARRPASRPPRCSELPELDLRVWHDSSSRPQFAEQLSDIAHRSGFCYLTGHGITQQRSTKLLGLARRFFALPEEQRLAVEHINSPHFRGYTPAGRELTSGRMDWREPFDIGRERPALPLRPGDPSWRRLTGPNQWPAELPELRPAMLELLEELQGIGSTLLSALAVGLDMHEDLFTEWFGHQAHTRLKLLHYPSRPLPDHEQGAGTHKDYGFLSMVIQDSQGGLQIADEQAGWIDVTPRSGRLVVNLGEMLALYRRRALAKDVGVSPDGTGPRPARPQTAGRAVIGGASGMRRRRLTHV
ncbi:2-oxoglutarate and iron-dependent oxygenase domain-containing protein [Streptomyces sp. NPDC048483]|uniref:isopenicillin N synthase family dioxygenase n=1 Tax=Streptomyces sp. NPDC048483 TaxID=3154927 RepID=UPI0034364E75